MTDNLPAILLFVIFAIAAILIAEGAAPAADHELKVRSVKTMTYATDDLIDAEYLRK